MSEKIPKMSKNCPEELETQFSDIFWTIFAYLVDYFSWWPCPMLARSTHNILLPPSPTSKWSFWDSSTAATAESLQAPSTSFWSIPMEFPRIQNGLEIQAACYRIEKWKIQKIAGEGAGKSVAKIRGDGGSAGEGAAQHSSQHPPQPSSGFPISLLCSRPPASQKWPPKWKFLQCHSTRAGEQVRKIRWYSCQSKGLLVVEFSTSVRLYANNYWTGDLV